MNLTFLLLANALTLGIRHGIDWDHVAAILDIVGAVSTSQHGTDGSVVERQRSTIELSSLYALGHGVVVVLMATCAVAFASLIPSWLGPVMERLVGLTLIVFGLYVTYLQVNLLRGGERIHMQSRWMLVAGATANAVNWLRTKLLKKPPRPSVALERYGKGTAFGVGMLHGIGAETGTQVLIMAGVAGQSNHVVAAAMLTAFVTGFAISNTIVAILGASGVLVSEGTKWIYFCVAGLTGVFSLVIGICFVFGLSERLPDLQAILSGAF